MQAISLSAFGLPPLRPPSSRDQTLFFFNRPEAYADLRGKSTGELASETQSLECGMRSVGGGRSGAHFTGGAGDPPRLCREGKRKLTESSKEFPKGSARQRPEGSLREVRERRIPRHPLLMATPVSNLPAPDTIRGRGRSRRRRGVPWPPESPSRSWATVSPAPPRPASPPSRAPSASGTGPPALRT